MEFLSAPSDGPNAKLLERLSDLSSPVAKDDRASLESALQALNNGQRLQLLKHLRGQLPLTKTGAALKPNDADGLLKLLLLDPSLVQTSKISSVIPNPARFPTFEAFSKPTPNDPDLQARFKTAEAAGVDLHRYIDSAAVIDALRSVFPKGDGSHSEPRIPLFGYGSLANKTSALRTIQDEQAVAEGEYVHAVGTERVFEKDVRQNIPTSAYSTASERSLDNPYRASLNMVRSDSPGDLTNGTVYWVRPDELHDLAAREEGYDLLPVTVQAPGKEPYVAYTFSVTSKRDHYRATPDLLPRPGYLETVRSAMEEISADALDDFLRTTKIANNTTLADYFAQNKLQGS